MARMSSFTFLGVQIVHLGYKPRVAMKVVWTGLGTVTLLRKGRVAVTNGNLFRSSLYLMRRSRTSQQLAEALHALGEITKKTLDEHIAASEAAERRNRRARAAEDFSGLADDLGIKLNTKQRRAIEVAKAAA